MQPVSENNGDVVAFLLAPQSYGLDEGVVEHIETHISHVFLAGDFAYKLKKPVAFPYLDFSTADLRKAACENELVINRRTAPQLYLRVACVKRNQSGKLSIDGEGAAVDWLVVMRRFDQEQLLAHLAEQGRFEDGLPARLAEKIFAFHQQAASVHTDFAATARAIIDSSAEILRSFSGQVFEKDDVESLIKSSLNTLARNADLLQNRVAGGKIRHCHGDLHVGNVVLLKHDPVLFDGIEFNDSFTRIDVLYDLAFLLMDLHVRGLADEASVVFNTYMDLSGDYGGLALLPLFLSMRAAIRAHVGATAGKAQESRRYFGFARKLLTPPGPRMISLGGVSGTGKSTLARSLSPLIGPVPGALIVRTDVVRKNLLGVPLSDTLSSSGYTPEITRRTYDRVNEIAAMALAAGHSVITDSVSAKPKEREAFQTIAHKAGVPFTGIWLTGSPAVLEKRVSDRRGDVSDATVEVLRSQLAYDLGDMKWHVVDTDAGSEIVLKTTRDYLG